jgi:hypothetical protein
MHPERVPQLLEFLDDLAEREGLRQDEQDMDVDGDAADSECWAAHLVEGSREVSEQFVADGLGDDGLAVFGAEDEVDDVAGEGLSHGVLLVPVFQTGREWGNRFLGRCPRLGCATPAE